MAVDSALRAVLDFATPAHPERSSRQAMEEALARLGNPHQALRVIHVGGTSGKTSTCYFLQSLLRAAGQHCGMTISPHIRSFSERVQIDGHPLDARRFSAYVERMLTLLAPLRGRLTYFELVTSLAWWVFRAEQVDYAIVEVGIGGLADATNVARRPDKVAVIGPVGLDHTEKLGGTIEQIAAHKAGIMVPGGVAFVARQSPAAEEVIQHYAEVIGARVVLVAPGPDRWADASEPAYQGQNWALAQAVVSYLAARDRFALPGVGDQERARQVSPPARFEWLALPGHRVLLDGAHNPSKMAALAGAIRAQGLGRLPTLATLSTAGPDKIAATVARLAPVVSYLIVPEFSLGSQVRAKQSLPAGQMAQAARRAGLAARVVPDLTRAVSVLLSDPSPNLLVTGSLYLAAQVRPMLMWAQAGSSHRSTGRGRASAGARPDPVD
jgi:dihydrofolate synthase/folylpolyglutamate synthase